MGYSTTLRILLALAASMMTAAASASELGSSSYPLGAQTVASAFLPPPGQTAAYNYLLYYRATSFRDDAGRSSIPGFRADLVAEAVRIVHTWDFTLAGLNFSSSVIEEADYLKVRAAGAHDHSLDFDLIDIDPLHITGQIGKFHFLIGTNIYLPVGEYHPHELANSPTHYFTYAQEFALTWMPTPAWDRSINPNLSFNCRNDDTGYSSGDLVGVTWGINYRPLPSRPAWEVGANGFYGHQFTDDRQNGERVLGGARLEKVGIGPQLVYFFSPAAAVVAKWHHEMHVRNAPKGDLLWLEAVFPLGFGRSN